MARYDEEAEERAAAVAEVAARLRSRGIALTGAEDPGDLADLLSAVERFEAAVEAHGGDLMVDDLKSSQPDDRHFVVPRRELFKSSTIKSDRKSTRLNSSHERISYAVFCLKKKNVSHVIAVAPRP